jgi:YhhN family
MGYASPLTFLLLLLLTITTTAGFVLPATTVVSPALVALLLPQMLLVIAIAAVMHRGLPTDPPWPRVGTWLLAGVLVSFVGDLNNLRLIDLTAITPAQTLLSIPLFATAHLLYILSFHRLSRPHFATNPKFKRRTLCVWPVLAIAAWWLLVPDALGPVERAAAFVYAFLVVGLGVASLWLVAAYGRRAWPSALGGWLFVFSDGLIAVHLPDPAPLSTSMVIWLTYVLAQLLIVRTMRLASLPR